MDGPRLNGLNRIWVDLGRTGNPFSRKGAKKILMGWLCALATSRENPITSSLFNYFECYQYIAAESQVLRSLSRIEIEDRRSDSRVAALYSESS